MAAKDPEVALQKLERQKSVNNVGRDLNNEKATGCVIDPRYSHWVGYWDLVTSLALVFTALAAPIEVAFIQQLKFVTQQLQHNRGAPPRPARRRSPPRRPERSSSHARAA